MPAVDAVPAARYEVSPPESSLAVDARSTLHNVKAKAVGLNGYVVVAWNADGSLAPAPAPVMHVEFPVDAVRSGNAIQDREMQKLVDSARFPKVAGDLRSVEQISPGHYKASGEITLAGRARTYGGEFTIGRDGDGLTVEGALSLDIRDFGLKPPSLLILKVDPILRVGVRLVARKAA